MFCKLAPFPGGVHLYEVTRLTDFGEFSSVEDGSVRYVAEENIDLILPNFSDLPSSLTSIAGKHFKRWDEESRAFVSNMRDEYPDN
jgi:hypothetical protein